MCGICVQAKPGTRKLKTEQSHLRAPEAAEPGPVANLETIPESAPRPATTTEPEQPAGSTRGHGSPEAVTEPGEPRPAAGDAAGALEAADATGAGDQA